MLRLVYPFIKLVESVAIPKIVCCDVGTYQ